MIREMIISIYKKRGPTSRDVVNIIKRAVKENKVGHAGTLDPLAEGVLIIGIGRESTKKLHTKEFGEKEYVGVIKLGETSSTDDEEGEKRVIDVTKKPTSKIVESVVSSFCGEIKQTPPVFSAVKINGKEAYKLARKGLPVKIKERMVLIKEIEIMEYAYPFLKIRVVTGSGVYIRSLARDIGEKLNTGGYLYSLIRTRVANFKLEDSSTVEEVLDNLK